MNTKKRRTKNDLIYKYTAVTEYTFRNLLTNELYFSIPKNVNDPFDSRFNLKPIGLTKEGVADFYKSKNLSEEELKVKFQLFDESPSEIELEIEVEYNNRLIIEYAIACFSEDNDSILMWAHYADNFKGICLIFDWKIHPEYFQGFKVQYKKNIPIVSYDGNGNLEAGDIFLTKLDFWKYEKEVRSIVNLDGGRNPIKYNPRALVGIIFGNRIDPENKRSIQELIRIRSEYSRVKFYNAIPNYRNKEVVISPY